MTEEKRLALIEARRQYQRDYYKRWRQENPDKVRAINERFYAKKAAEIQARNEREENNHE